MDENVSLPEIHLDDCDGCALCVPVCPVDALRVVDHKVIVTLPDDCEYCGNCEEACPTGAITCPYEIVIEDEAV